MTDFILDADPFIPTGTEATPEDVARLIAEDKIPADVVTKLAEKQRPNPEQLGNAANKYGNSDTAKAKKRMKDAGLDVA